MFCVRSHVRDSPPLRLGENAKGKGGRSGATPSLSLCIPLPLGCAAWEEGGAGVGVYCLARYIILLR